MGFTNYQKILEEAITELKETKFQKYSLKTTNITCNIETDLELLIPNNYVSDTSERLNLYKRISNIKTEEEIQIFTNELTDRFGIIPTETIELLKSI